MTWDEKGKIWMDGQLVDWNDAKIHSLSHVIHYGTSVFEGLRAYKNNKGLAIFRLKEHVDRLFESARVYNMKIPFTPEKITEGVIETIKVNNLESCYIRPISFRGYGELGVNSLNCPVNTTIAAWEWGSYLGDEGMINGVNVGVSSWRKPAPDTFPTLAKCGANYMNSQLAKMEALEHGYDEAIMLDYQGFVGEGTGENIFIIEDNSLITPPLCSSILKGITRDSVIKLAEKNDLKVKEEIITRERLYFADEMFFTGTAAEITPIRSVDGREIGKGIRGDITEKLQNDFFDILLSDSEDIYGWLTYI